MKVIKTDAAISASANSTLTGYPASNAIDEHPKKQWKAAAAATTATLTVTATGTVNAIAMFNIDAESVTLNISDPNAVVWDDTVTVGSAWESSGSAWGGFDYDYELTINESSYENYKAAWFEFDDVLAFGLEFDITVTTSETADDLGIGKVHLGEIAEFPNPVQGLQEGQKDFSIIKELSNGATYKKPRDIVRTFNGRIQVALDTEFYSFMEDFARKRGPSPSSWRLTDIDDFNWVVFARFATRPASTHSHTTHSDINFDIIEVL